MSLSARITQTPSRPVVLLEGPGAAEALRILHRKPGDPQLDRAGVCAAIAAVLPGVEEGAGGGEYELSWSHSGGWVGLEHVHTEGS